MCATYCNSWTSIRTRESADAPTSAGGSTPISGTNPLCSLLQDFTSVAIAPGEYPSCFVCVRRPANVFTTGGAHLNRARLMLSPMHTRASCSSCALLFYLNCPLHTVRTWHVASLTYERHPFSKYIARVQQVYQDPRRDPLVMNIHLRTTLPCAL